MSEDGEDALVKEKKAKAVKLRVNEERKAREARAAVRGLVENWFLPKCGRDESRERERRE